MAETCSFLVEKLQKNKWWIFIYYQGNWKSERQTLASHSFLYRALFSHSTYLLTQYYNEAWQCFIYFFFRGDTASTSQHVGHPVSLLVLCFIGLGPNKSAVRKLMFANLSLPSYIMILVKCWEELFFGLGVLTKKVTAKVTQNSLSDREVADEVCVFDE